MTRIIGVMSTFRPDYDVLDRARQHIKQIDELVIVDDGSPDASVLDNLAEDAISVIRLPQNAGIAAALNAGTRVALERGADFILHLDQDTLLDPDYVKRVIDTFECSAMATRLGIVLSDCVNHQPSIPPRYSPEGFGLVDEGIQSGLVVSRECLLDVGLLDERLFIDCVDIEFCLRAGDHGWRIAVASGSNITHSLGRMELLRPFGVQRFKAGQPVRYQYHPPFREYYITRNNIDLCLRNLFKRPRWVLSVARREFVPHIKVLLSGPHAGKQWLAISVGSVHGLIRRRGKIPNWLARAVAE